MSIRSVAQIDFIKFSRLLLAGILFMQGLSPDTQARYYIPAGCCGFFNIARLRTVSESQQPFSGTHRVSIYFHRLRGQELGRRLRPPAPSSRLIFLYARIIYLCQEDSMDSPGWLFLVGGPFSGLSALRLPVRPRCLPRRTWDRVIDVFLFSPLNVLLVFRTGKHHACSA